MNTIDEKLHPYEEKIEVERDVHCCRLRLRPMPITSAVSTFRVTLVIAAAG